MFAFISRAAAAQVWLFVALLVFAAVIPSSAHAQTAASTTQSAADQTNSQIAQLQAEIAQLQAQLNSTDAQKQTLQNAVNSLNLNIKKLQKSITLTNDEMSQADGQITQLSTNISTTSGEITQMEGSIANSLRELDALDYESPLIALVTGGTLSSFFDESASLDSVRTDMENKITQLSSLKTNLQTSKTATQQKRAQLATLQQNLTEQKQGLAITQQSQTQLLAQTKDQESAYEAEIAQKQAQEAQFEQGLLSEGSQLNLTVAPGTLPPPGPELAWPISNTAITQYFGNTPFATQNPSVYNGHGHDGIDLRASPGTPVMAARSGIIVGTGNTDLACPGASFGKWIFIQHDDGLSTMYAHLSVILVSAGQQVTTGQVIAYSDTTGYAIGPHLHFGVYATAGSEIKTWPTTNPRPECYGNVWTMPVATLSAYLNPLTYLPPLPK